MFSLKSKLLNKIYTPCCFGHRKLVTLTTIIFLLSNNIHASGGELFTTENSVIELSEIIIDKQCAESNIKRLSNSETELLTQATQTSCDLSSLYNTNFLRNTPAANTLLKKAGFKDIYFQTEDNLWINALMLDQSTSQQIKGTIIACPGFFPGRKEGMGTLYAMLQDQPYNMVLLDFRGHGESDGELLTPKAIINYGKHEFYDISAAINYIYTYNKENAIHHPIIVHGLCAGAFHAIKAINHLKSHNSEVYQVVQGVICDSSWNTLAPVAQATLTAEIDKRCPAYYGIKNLLQNIIGGIYQLGVKPYYAKIDSIENLMENLDQKFLFIHAENDSYTNYQYAHNLIEKTPQSNKQLWMIYDESSHAVNHLKHKDKYKKIVEQFLDSIHSPLNKEDILTNNRQIHLQHAVLQLKSKLKKAQEQEDSQTQKRLERNITIVMKYIN